MSHLLAEALATAGLADFQPRYRKMLVELKAANPTAYEEAVSRYRDSVESCGARGDALLAVWLEYGRWLADRLADGTLHAVDENGLASEVRDAPPLGPLLMHLPSDARVRGRVVACPETASEAQRETAALLCQ